MHNHERIFKILEEREQAQISLAHFAAYTMDVTPALHHRVICDAMDAMWDKDDPYDELIILAPPGSAKSTYTSIALPTYYMGRNPMDHVLTASYSTELAEKWGRRVRNLLVSPRCRTLFNVGLSSDSQAAGRWANNKGGEFYGAGVGSGILGFRADLAIIDDPISGFEQAQSETQLQKVHNWYETDFATRLKPNAKTVLICQRLARNDLAGYLIDRNIEQQTKRQRILKLRMEATTNDPLGREPGERLWPEWFTPEMVIDAKRDDFKWRTLYQQEPPADDGSWVSVENIHIVDIAPATLSKYILTDLALSVNTGDYSVHIVVGVGSEGDIYVLEAWRARCDPNDTVEKHIAMTLEHNPLESLIDDDNMAKVYVQLLGSKCREMGVNLPWKTLPMRGQNKETRAAPLRGLFKRGKMHLVRGEWNKWLMNELLTFPNAIGQGVDDGVDALGLIGRRLMMLARPSNVVSLVPKVKTIHDVTLNELWEDRESGSGSFGRGRV